MEAKGPQSVSSVLFVPYTKERERKSREWVGTQAGFSLPLNIFVHLLKNKMETISENVGNSVESVLF